VPEMFDETRQALFHQRVPRRTPFFPRVGDYCISPARTNFNRRRQRRGLLFVGVDVLRGLGALPGRPAV
jgi:hypothetical protein